MKLSFFHLRILFLVLSCSGFSTAQVVANFSQSGTTGCVNTPVNFTDLSTGPVINWLWDFGDGGTSPLQSPSYTYSSTGTYTITLTVDDGAGDIDVFTETYVVKSPTSNFFVNTHTSCSLPTTIFFTDGSVLPDTWAWSFGDASSSVAQNPIHSYTTAGGYKVVLTVTDTINGCTDNFSDSIKIAVLNTNFTASPTFGCGPLTVNFTNTSVNNGYGSIVSYLWDFGDGATSTAVNPSHTYNNPGNYTVILTATNSLGCIKTNTKTNFIQVIGPSVDFNADVLSAPCTPQSVNFTNSATSSSPIVNYSWNFGDGGTSGSANPTHVYTTYGTFDVTLSVSDLDGCSKTLVKPAYITLEDVSAPVFTLCPSDQNVGFSATCDYTLPDYTLVATSTDNCGTPVMTQSPLSGSTISTTQTITLTATDAAGNFTTCLFDVIPADNTPPVITCPSDQNVNLSATCDYTLIDYTGLAVSSDNCGPFVVTQSPIAGTIISSNQTISLICEDGNGNSATCNFDVIPVDNIPPSISCPSDQNVNFSATCDYVLSDYTGLASSGDNCGGLVITQLPVAGTSVVSTTSVTLNATDLAGNSATCSFAIVTVDATPPAITCPSDISQNSDSGLCSATVSYSTPVGTDNCSGAATSLTSGLPSGSDFPIGTTVVSYEVIDGAGLSSTCSFNVTVIDAEIPGITCPGAVIQNNDPGQCGAAVVYADPVFSDNCAGSVLSQISGIPSAGLFPIGITVNTFEVQDAAGNTNSCSFNITIIDNELPAITCADSVFSCDSLIVVDNPITADNCPGEMWTLISGVANGNFFPVGETTNTYQVIDAAGNIATCNTVITRFVLPTVNFETDQIMLGAGNSVSVDAVTSNVVSYSWYPTEGINDPTIEDPVFNPTQPTVYTLTVTSSDGCQSSAGIEILVDTQIEINNFVSPNADGKNDTWIIKGNYLLNDCTVQIFDSWGNSVYESTGYDNDWNGTQNGHELNEGVYYYVISCGSDKPLTGSITLIK